MSIAHLKERIRSDPRFFCNEVLGVYPWEKQLEVILGVRDHSCVSVRSGHGTGKSFVAACIALWFLYSHYPAKVITTAPTWVQVRQILWNEIRRLHSGSLVPLGGKVLEERLKLSDESFAIGISTDEAERFQGYHAQNLLVILDEAPGVRPEIWEAAHTLLTGQTGKMLAIGNPTRPHGKFFDTFKPNSGWVNVSISCLDCPNIKQNEIIYPNLVTAKWIEDRRRDWTEDSAIWKSRVLGEFPDEDVSLLIPASWFSVPQNKKRKKQKGAIRLGVDVARYGTDSTAFVLRNDIEVMDILEVRGWDTMQTAGKVIDYIRQMKLDAEQVYIDDTGVGAGVTDRLREEGYEVNAVVAASKSADHARFLNMRAQMFWRLRQALEPDNDTFIIADKYASLQHELSEITFCFTSTGAIKIEDKHSLRPKLQGSPNLADALALTFSGNVEQYCEGIVSIL